MVYFRSQNVSSWSAERGWITLLVSPRAFFQTGPCYDTNSSWWKKPPKSHFCHRLFSLAVVNEFCNGFCYHSYISIINTYLRSNCCQRRKVTHRTYHAQLYCSLIEVRLLHTQRAVVMNVAILGDIAPCIRMWTDVSEKCITSVLSNLINVNLQVHFPLSLSSMERILVASIHTEIGVLFTLDVQCLF
jgi:hypothetical protein